MNNSLIRILMLLTIPVVISAVVKIGISPVKETNVSVEENATTVLSTGVATSTEATTITTPSSSLSSENTTISPTQMTTINGSGTMQNNATLLVSATVPTPVLNATDLAHLPEFTIRMMRRKLTSYDYYCPCDLKVRSLRIASNDYWTQLYESCIFSDKFLWHKLLLWHWLLIEGSNGNAQVRGSHVVHSRLRRNFSDATVFGWIKSIAVLHRWRTQETESVQKTHFNGKC